MKLPSNRAEQFFAKIDRTPACWLWTAARTDAGYGAFFAIGKNRAHAVSYVHHKGEYAAELQMDHLCSNLACVNPDHLEAVTFEQNQARKKIRNRWRGWPTHCKAGHVMDDLNTFWRANGRGRQCRVCQRDRQSEHSVRNGGEPYSGALGPNGTLKNRHLYNLTAQDYEAAGITEAFIEVFWECDAMLPHGERGTSHLRTAKPPHPLGL